MSALVCCCLLSLYLRPWCRLCLPARRAAPLQLAPERFRA